MTVTLTIRSVFRVACPRTPLVGCRDRSIWQVPKSPVGHFTGRNGLLEHLESYRKLLEPQRTAKALELGKVLIMLRGGRGDKWNRRARRMVRTEQASM